MTTKERLKKLAKERGHLGFWPFIILFSGTLIEEYIAPGFFFTKFINTRIVFVGIVSYIFLLISLGYDKES